MRHVTVCLWVLVCLFATQSACADSKKLVILCEELSAVHIKQPPEGVPVAGKVCGDKCFYIDFFMQHRAARRLNAEYNTYKLVPRDIFIGDSYLWTAEPLHIDVPYSHIVSSRQVYTTLEEAVCDVRTMCPKADIMVPYAVRR